MYKQVEIFIFFIFWGSHFVWKPYVMEIKERSRIFSTINKIYVIFYNDLAPLISISFIISRSEKFRKKTLYIYI